MRKFETNRYKANAICPCGKCNRDGKFATEKGCSGQAVGYCHSCGKNFTNETLTQGYIKPYKAPEPIIYCKSCTEAVNDNYDADLKSEFAQFLVRTFGKDNAIKVVEEYHLGEYYGKVIFWQIDSYYKGRAGKILAYNDDGKRGGYANWWHSVNKEDCKLQQCFFGQHLIDESDKPIAIVEGAKTACIMHLINPYFMWLSAEGADGLSTNKCESIKRFDVTLFPDAGWYDKWNEKAQEYDFKISRECEKWMGEKIIKHGDDIADYYLNSYSPEILSTV
jgi:hypothetical protein